MDISSLSASTEMGVGYAMLMEKKMIDQVEQVAMGELEMLPPAPAMGDYIDTYA